MGSHREFRAVPVEMLGHDANGVRVLPFRKNVLPRIFGIAAEFGLPKAIVHHEHEWSARLAVGRSKIPS